MMADRNDISPMTDPGGGLHMYNFEMNGSTLNGSAQKVSSYLSDTVFADLVTNNRETYTEDQMTSSLTNSHFDNFSVPSQYISIQPLDSNGATSNGYGKTQGLLYNMPPNGHTATYGSSTLPDGVTSLLDSYPKNGEKTSQSHHNNTSIPHDDHSFITMLSAMENSAMKREKQDYIDNGMVSLAAPVNSTSHNFDSGFPANVDMSAWGYFPNNGISSASTDDYMSGVQMHTSQSFNSGFNGSSQSFLPPSHPSMSYQMSDSLPRSQSAWGLPAQVNPSINGSRNKRSPDTAGKEPGALRKYRRKSASENGMKSPNKTTLTEKNSALQKNGSKKVVDENVLDSAARDRLVSLLMDNLRTTVQFESFCLSFPRSRKKEMAFRHKVLLTSNLSFSLQDKAIKSQPFPDKFIKSGEAVVSVFRKALSNSGKEASTPGDYSEQVEEQIPFSMLWVIRLEQTVLTANWEGQFVAAINPINGTLVVSIFQFQPKFSQEGEKCLEQVRLTKDLAKDITENMEQFEVSRQLRFDIKLKDIAKLYLYSPYGDENEGMLIIQTPCLPQFYQRWLHTSAENMNRWQKRSNFLAYNIQGSQYTFYLGGLVSELNEVLALMLASEKNLQKLFYQGTEKPFIPVSVEPDSSHLDVHPDSTNHNGTEEQDLEVLRAGIISVLREYHLIRDIEAVNFVVMNGNLLSNSTHSPSKSVRKRKPHFEGLPAELPPCLKDYIVYKCTDAETLRSALSTPLKAKSHGFSESDFRMDRCWGVDIENMTVGELILWNCSDKMYYSFCKNELGQVGHEEHCDKCHSCNLWRYWHCSRCDECTCGEVCDHCGCIKDHPDQVIIKPLSVFRNQLHSGSLALDDVKEAWKASLHQTNTDVLQWTSSIPEELPGEALPAYNSSNAMVDQLGLLNPVGFLLGQPSIGATRKHRRNKKIDGSLMPSVESSKYSSIPSDGQGCVVQ